MMLVDDVDREAESGEEGVQLDFNGGSFLIKRKLLLKSHFKKTLEQDHLNEVIDLNVVDEKAAQVTFARETPAALAVKSNNSQTESFTLSLKNGMTNMHLYQCLALVRST